ncbi:cytochrome ubiquinol oxidase subunit I, partial [Sutterella wadsworthensis]
PMFWSFRVMIGCGLALLLLYVVGLYFSVKKTLDTKTLYLRATLLALPLPWIACEVGWFVAEYGRQPWTIYNILPTHLSVSSLTSGDLIGSILGFVVLYTLMLIAEMWLMVRFCRKGPSSLGTGRYHFEQQ